MPSAVCHEKVHKELRAITWTLGGAVRSDACCPRFLLG